MGIYIIVMWIVRFIIGVILKPVQWIAQIVYWLIFGKSLIVVLKEKGIAKLVPDDYYQTDLFIDLGFMKFYLRGGTFDSGGGGGWDC